MRTIASYTLCALGIVTMTAAASGQQQPVPQPFPRPGQQPSRPSQPPPTPPPTTSPAGSPSAPPSAVAPTKPAGTQDEVTPTEAMLGVPIYPGAQFIRSYDAG